MNVIVEHVSAVSLDAEKYPEGFVVTGVVPSNRVRAEPEVASSASDAPGDPTGPGEADEDDVVFVDKELADDDEIELLPPQKRPKLK